jgi:hypothetical protein
VRFCNPSILKVYDKRRLLTSETVTISSAWAFTLGYGHDANGHLAATTYPDERIVGYAPNALGQPTQAGAYATGATYYPDGAVESYTFGNGLIHTMTENTRDLPGRVTDAYGSTAVHDDGYDYDPDADVAAITDYTTGSLGDRNMTYDGLDRLKEADSPMFGGDDKAIYTYDALDNLLTARVGSGTSYGYVYGGLNRLAQLTNATTGAVVNSYTYNAQGDLATKNSQTYQFDMADRLRGAPALGSYLYDAAGRRVQKTEAVSGRVLESMYDKAGQLVFQWEPATQNGTDYIYLGDTLVARVVGNNSQVTGNIDGAPTAASPSVGGWACSTGLTQSITVEMFVGGPSGGGGTLIGSYTANQPSEPAVATSCHTSGANYRFSIPLATATRSQDAGEPIYMYGVSPVGNSNAALSNSGVYTVPANAGAPVAPASISVPASSSTGNITVSWSSSSGATSYVLQRQMNGGSWTQVYSGSATSAAFSGLTNGTYVYQVHACNSAGCSAFSTSGALTVALIPVAPASISVPASSYSASFGVSWPASANASSYTLERSVNGGGWGVLYNGSATSDTVTVSASGTYKYEVAACSAAGCSGYTVSGNVAVTLPPSAAPTLSGPSSSVSGTYTLSWTAITGATRYQLNQNGNGTVTTPYNGGGGSWSSSSLGDGTYDYQVFACNAAGCGPGSNVVAVGVLLVPGAPSYMTAPRSVNYPGNSWSLAIAPVAGASSYNLRRTDTSTGAATVLSNVGSNPTDYTYQGVYQYAGQACNASGCSGWTNAANTTTVVCKAPSGGALQKPAAGTVRPDVGCQ